MMQTDIFRLSVWAGNNIQSKVIIGITQMWQVIIGRPTVSRNQVYASLSGNWLPDGKLWSFLRSSTVRSYE